MFQHILAPLDGSVLAEQALSHAKRLVTSDTRVTLLQVVRSPLPVIAPEMAAPMPIDSMDDAMTEASRYLRSKVNDLIHAGIKADMEVVPGDACSHCITSYAQEHNVDLIVMSTHGRGGLSRLVFGSVTEEVIRETPCPVLVIRPG